MSETFPGLTPQPAPPTSPTGRILPGLPAARAGYQTKYSALAPTLGGLPSHIRSGLINIDAERVSRGQMPLSYKSTDPTRNQTLVALQAALSEQPVAKKSEDKSLLGVVKGLPSNALRNLRDVATIVPSMVIPNRGNVFYKEAQAITELPQRLGEMGSMADVATLPGVRLVPGAYVAENVLGATNPETGQRGSPSELLRNPIFTGLDVLPYASKAAKATKTVRAANTAYQEQFARLADTMPQGLVPPYSPPRPLPTLVARRMPKPGEAASTRIAGTEMPTPAGTVPRAGTAAMRQVADLTGIGRLANQTWGQRARQTTRMKAYEETLLAEGADLMTGDPTRILTEDFGIPERSAAQLTPAVEAFRAAYPESWTDPRAAAARRQQITRALERGDRELTTIPDITDAERAWAQRGIEVGDAVRRYHIGQGDLWEIPNSFGGQMASSYSKSAGGRLSDDLARQIDEYETALRGETLRPDQVVALENMQRYIGRSSRPDFEAAQYRAQLDALLKGEATNLARPMRVSKGRAVAQPTVTDFAALPKFANALMPYARAGNKMADRILQALRNPSRDSIRLAQTSLRTMRSSAKWADVFTDIRPDDVAALLSDMRHLDTQIRRAERTAAKGPDPTRQAKSYLNKLKEAMPERLRPLAEDAFRERAITVARQRNFEAIPDEDLVRMIDENAFDSIPNMAVKGVREEYARVIKNWPAIKAALPEGMDPVFIHRARLDAPERLANPKTSSRPVTPRDVKDRMNDMTPYADDIQVAVHEQVYDLINEQVSRELADGYRDFFAKTEATVLDEYRNVVRARGVSGPDVTAQATKLMGREWVRYDPDALFQGGKVKGGLSAAEKYVVPRDVHRTIEMLNAPPGERWASIMDAPMKLFRASVLALSPRWHLNNQIGGAILTMARDPRALGYVVTHFREIRDLMHNSTSRPSGFPASGNVSMPSEKFFAKPVRPSEQILAARSHLAGAKMAGMLDDFLRKAPAPVRARTGRSVIEWSYYANQIVDDMYRGAAYLSERNRGLTKGMTAKQAELQGIGAARRTLQEWDAMTPIERQVIRSLVPFYGWANFILRYAYTYPFDHPIRTSITASLARAEFTDRQLGQDWNRLFQMGHMDAEGNATFLNTRGANPFADAFNPLTVEGFIGQVNPGVSAILQSLGVDPISGRAELYPEVTFDEQSGRLVAKTPNIFETFVGSILPQYRTIDALFLDADRYRDFQNRDPEAAGRMLMGSIGMPTYIRTENIPQARMETELERLEAQDEARGQALKTGDLGAMSRYPMLAPYARQLETLLSQGKLAEFDPGDANPSPLAEIGRGLLTSVGG